MDAEHNDDSLVDIDGVCERCRSIAWDGSKSSQFISDYSTDHQMFHVISFVEGCRICRFLTRFLSSNFGSTFPNEAVLKTSPCKDERLLGPGLESSFVCSFEIQATTSSHTLPHNARGLIVISRLDPTTATSAFQHLSPPEVPISRIKNWIKACEDCHGQCRLDEYPHLSDLRVIDCERQIVINAPTKCKFVALSYVWGDPKTQSGVQDTVNLQQQPRTIQQSISTTLDLGYKYLWVDRCCIVQEDVEDKARQISQMASIYKAAQLTIIAAAGADPAHGLPGVRPHLRPSQDIYHETIDSFCLSALPAMRNLADIADSKWASRAWTFQEGFSSRRRLIFTNRQVIFVCNTDVFYESPVELDHTEVPNLDGWIPPRHRNTTSIRSTSRKYPLQGIIRSLTEYSGRDLTREDDALRAIEGTLNMLLKKNENHIWGVPFRFLGSVSTAGSRSRPVAVQSTDSHLAEVLEKVEICLLWHHYKPCRRRSGFPSWSTLGWAGSKTIPWLREETYTGFISLHTPEGPKALPKCNIRYDTDLTSPPKKLEIIAKVMDMRVGLCRVESPWESSSSEESSKYATFDVSGEVEVRDYAQLDDNSLEFEDCLKAMVVNKHLMLLKPQDGHYERIGFCTWSTGSLTDFLRRGLLYEKKSARHMELPLSYQQQAQFEACCQGDHDNEPWWEDMVKEELIVLG
ncbi:uncharacterized protein EKO05_0008863 [Ascochyta rabiei]|uniref:Uncharacterized protein n=1 Tax=Didymella rabiei TaxID=5454 RepID=A0A163ASW2_DIDRA|nr:uncharacterized protein EKO05_0008863 [Ascochyta rabiei]KZM21365.1 hypothetical protein ST47_g7496 [Ascochyta rabiei]UPX18569.1 hypothetical protein EKO05_0008863 [Ascochyta rabiei]